MSRGEGSGEGVDDTRLSDTQRYINITEEVILEVGFRIPKNLCASINEDPVEGRVRVRKR